MKKKKDKLAAQLRVLAGVLVGFFLTHRMRLVIFESCLGGILPHHITNHDRAGSVLEEGRVVFSKRAKIRLGVPEWLLDKYGPYHPVIAAAMALAGLILAPEADVSISATGTVAKADERYPENSIPGLIFDCHARRGEGSCFEFNLRSRQHKDHGQRSGVKKIGAIAIMQSCLLDFVQNSFEFKISFNGNADEFYRQLERIVLEKPAKG